MISGKVLAQNPTEPDTSIILFEQDTLRSSLDEVVITGARMPKKIIDIPYPVTRIKTIDYRQGKLVGIDDALGAVPGLFMQSRYGNHDVRISIRGFGSQSNSGIRGVRILLDGIPESEPDGQTRIEAVDFNSISSIEVVKGNSSSLYTNAPGGVVNFIHDMDFDRSFVSQMNQFGYFGLSRNSIQAGVRTDNYRLLNTYTYQGYDGYRKHSNEYWHILNTVVQTKPTNNTSLTLYGYFVDGMIKLPGSLTKKEFEENPFQADQKNIDRDTKRISTKGRLGIRYNAKFGDFLDNEIEITTYGTIKYFERTSSQYRIINRNGLGLSGKYIRRSKIAGNKNEFSVGGDLLFQPARTEYYENLGGMKGDQLLQLTDEKISNTGFYISENYEILKRKFYVLLTGRFDDVTYKLSEETLPMRDDKRKFQAFTPKLALNYKITPRLAVYSSFGLSFDSPAKNELESEDPGFLYNDELEAQESKNMEAGIKGNWIRQDHEFLKSILFEFTAFNIIVENEIVPYEVLGNVYFRNAATTNRKGLEAGATMQLLKGLDLSIAYTYSHFRYTDYSALTIELDSTGTFIQKEKDFSGNMVPSVPENNLYLAIQYAYALYQDKVSAFSKLSYRSVSGLWVDDANTDQTDPYQILNAVVGFDMKLGNFNILLSGGVNNILDEIYVGFTNTNSADKRFYEAGAPRNYFLSLKLGYTF
ncbi:MAG: TonB-dependent receptor [Bacteroidota bacterium]|nr:TonB-dependent receptor [Bacteroidota bacterium]